MTQLKHKFSKIGLSMQSLTVLLMCSMVVACGGKAAKATENGLAQSGATKADITRPPQTIVGRKVVKESNPDETISYDEWRAKRLEELERQQQKDE